VIRALATHWQLNVVALSFVPQGGGAYHWAARAEDGRDWFVTCDDLDTKPWLGPDRTSVLTGLNAAYGAARSLRETAGLAFVVAPVPTVAGDPTARLDARHSLAVLPYVDGAAGHWGEPLAPDERRRLLELLAELHGVRSASTAQVPARRSTDVAGRHHLETALGQLGQVWDGGPYAEPVRGQLRTAGGLVTRWLGEYDDMASHLEASALRRVVTHGEPHPGNVIRGTDGLSLIDWDTVAMDRAERDLWMFDDGTGSVAAYERLTGRSVDPRALGLYRRAWALSDLAAFVARLRRPHADDEDSRKAWDAVGSILRCEEPRPFGAAAFER